MSDVEAHLAMSRAAGALESLSSGDRLSLFAAAMSLSSPCSVAALAEHVARPRRDVVRDLVRLQSSGLVDLEGSTVTVQDGFLSRLAADLVATQPFAHLVQRCPELARFTRHGRLTSLPVDAQTRRLVAGALGELLPPDRALNEDEVNHRVSAVGDDVASLRRLLVDLGVLTRGGSRDYRRVGVVDPEGRSHA